MAASTSRWVWYSGLRSPIARTRTGSSLGYTWFSRPSEPATIGEDTAPSLLSNAPVRRPRWSSSHLPTPSPPAPPAREPERGTGSIHHICTCGRPPRLRRSRPMMRAAIRRRFRQTRGDGQETPSGSRRWSRASRRCRSGSGLAEVCLGGVQHPVALLVRALVVTNRRCQRVVARVQLRLDLRHGELVIAGNRLGSAERLDAIQDCLAGLVGLFVDSDLTQILLGVSRQLLNDLRRGQRVIAVAAPGRDTHPDRGGQPGRRRR